MSASVKAILGKEKYYTEVTSGEKTLISDEPIDVGGQNKGFKPSELLASSLATCTAITLRMYMDRKGWNVERILVQVNVSDQDKDGTTTFSRKIQFEDAELSDEQLVRIRKIADACPVDKILTGKIMVETELQ